MKSIQPILVLLLFTAFGVYLRRFRSRLLDRVLITALLVVSIVLVMQPDLSNVIARFLGVGRGVDVVIYISIVGLGICCVLLLSRHQELQRQIVRLTREIAVMSVRPPGESESSATSSNQSAAQSS